MMCMFTVNFLYKFHTWLYIIYMWLVTPKFHENSSDSDIEAAEDLDPPVPTGGDTEPQSSGAVNRLVTKFLTQFVQKNEAM